MTIARVAGAVLVVGLVLSLGSGLSPARAADESTPDKDLQNAKESFENAQNAFVRGEYETAAQRFLAAYEKKNYPAFLFNAAVSFEKAKQLDKAKLHFERYLERDPNASDAAQVKLRIEVLGQMLAPPPAPVAPAAPPASPPSSDGSGAAPPPQPPVEGQPPPPEGAGPASPAGPPPAGAPPAAPPPAAPAAPVAPAPVLPEIDTKGLVVIDSKPQGATIYLNDKRKGPFGKTPWHGSLESKPLRLLLEAKGWKPEERAITPRSDKLIDIYIALSEEHYLGWVEIVSNVVGAEVYIDRKDIGAVGRTPFTGHLKPGKHTITLERFGFDPIEKTIDIQPGTATQHRMDMQASQKGWINAAGRTASGGRLIIDEKFACQVPCRAEVTPGRHEILVEKDGMEDYETELDVGRGVETTIEVKMNPRPPRTRAISSALVALIFIGGGLYVGNLAQEARDGLQADIRNGQLVDNDDPRFMRGKIEAIGANVLYGIGAIAGIAAVVSLFSHGPDSTAVLEHKKISFAPSVTGDGGGVAFWGRF